jgi:hypothetical protein
VQVQMDKSLVRHNGDGKDWLPIWQQAGNRQNRNKL